MEDLKRVIEDYIREAVELPENRKLSGDINWNLVDADVYKRLNPVRNTVSLFYKLFDEIATEIEYNDQITRDYKNHE
jgi:hypothetical protein|tara:strand:- start:45 stop:275 length:231 start_codon:yes stop_codon:yes gene_type:complete